MEQGDEPIGVEFEELENPDKTPDQACVIFFIERLGLTMLPGSKFYHNVGISIKDTKGRYYLRLSLSSK